MNPSDKQTIHDVLAANQLMVISTTSPNDTPQSAVVGCGVTDDLKILFGTSSKSRKARNLKRSEFVSAVIGWAPTATAQIEGTVAELSKADAEATCPDYFANSPRARFFKDHPDERYFILSPSWIRLTNITTQPWTIQEFKI